MTVPIGSMQRAVAVAVAVMLVVILMTACATGMLVLAAPATATGGHPTKPRPAAIRETFTVLPCSHTATPSTTIGQEGCVEHQIVRRDRQIDALNRTIATKLDTDAARRRFITAHNAWLAFRYAYCLSRSDTAQGGTLAGLIDAQCTAAISARHLVDLHDFLDDLNQN
jgi:uncharacterized protein YecT (DUF1311 family)